jgi:hypothetical protein
MSKTYNCSYGKLSGDNIIVVGSSNEITGNEVVIRGSYNKLNGSAQSVQGSTNTVSGDCDYVKGSYNTVGGNTHNIDGNHNTVKRNVNNVTGSYNEIYGNVSALNGNANRVGGNVDRVTGSYNDIRGTAGSITGSSNTTRFPGSIGPSDAPVPSPTPIISFSSSIGNIDFSDFTTDEEATAAMAARRALVGRGITQAVVINDGVLTINGQHIPLPVAPSPASCASAAPVAPAANPAKSVKPPVPRAIENESSAKPGEVVCCICLDRAVATRNNGCPHACLCVTCARELANEPELKCPKCRAVLKSVERLVIDYDTQ